MENFNFKVKTNEKVDLELIKKVNIRKLFMDENSSDLARVLNHFMVCDFTDFVLNSENSEENICKQYLKITNILQLSLQNLFIFQNKNLSEINEKYSKLKNKRDFKDRILKQQKILIEKSNNVNGEIEKIDSQMNEKKEKIQEMNFKFKCEQCSQVYEYSSFFKYLKKAV